MVATPKPRVRWIRTIPSLPKRSKTAHKGSCGKILVVGGSQGMAGAPCLASRAALRSGAGLVKTAVPKIIWDIAAIKLDECLTVGLPCNSSGTLSRQALKPLLMQNAWADVTVLGPGLGATPDTFKLVRQFIDASSGSMVLDADALNALADKPKRSIAGLRGKQKDNQLVLTPHPGEMARLLNRSIQNIQLDRKGAVLQCSRQFNCIVILKGAQTLVSDGQRIFKNRTGNPGMASGGTGDVLAGITGALIGQRMPAFEAACLAVHLHGWAGDIASKMVGEWSLSANDLIKYLPDAFLAHAKSNG